MNATSSPSCKAAAIRAYSAFTATDIVRSYCASDGISAVSALHTVWTVAESGTSRTSSPVPARSRSRAKSRTVTRMQFGTPSVSPSRHRDRLSPLPPESPPSKCSRSRSHDLLHALDAYGTCERVGAVRRHGRDDDDWLLRFRDVRSGDGSPAVRMARSVRLVHDQRESAQRQRLVRLVFEKAHTTPLIVVSHQPGERRDGATARTNLRGNVCLVSAAKLYVVSALAGHFANQCLRIERLGMSPPRGHTIIKGQHPAADPPCPFDRSGYRDFGALQEVVHRAVSVSRLGAARWRRRRTVAPAAPPRRATCHEPAAQPARRQMCSPCRACCAPPRARHETPQTDDRHRGDRRFPWRRGDRP